MTTFERRVAINLEGLTAISTGLAPGCYDCGNPDADALSNGDIAEEAGFSWSQCDGCDSTLGGSRHAAHGFLQHERGELLIHLDVCTDCLFYLNYGELPGESA